MAMPTISVIVDSSALVALLKLDDADNHKAVTIMNHLMAAQNKAVLLPTEVLAESLNILGKKLGKVLATESGMELLAQEAKGSIAFVPTQSSTLQAALELQLTATGGPSFIDCLVMALADEHHTPYIFGFDDTFRKNGYLLP